MRRWPPGRGRSPDFNYGNGTNNYNVLIQMNASPSAGIGANASSTEASKGKPSQGTMGIGWLERTTPSGNVAAGWWLDPTPNESSEFQGTTFNAFARNPTGAGRRWCRFVHGRPA
jgi:hypothetical protein